MQYMDPMGYSMAMILRTEDYIHCNSTTGENQRAPHETSLTSTTATIAPVAIWKKYLHFESGTYILYIYTLFYIYKYNKYITVYRSSLSTHHEQMEGFKGWPTLNFNGCNFQGSLPPVFLLSFHARPMTVHLMKASKVPQHVDCMSTENPRGHYLEDHLRYRK